MMKNLIFTLLLSMAPLTAQTLTTLASFNGTDGQGPSGRLVRGTDGNFYGTTFYGGTNTNGTVFKMTPGGTLTTLYNFCSLPGCADGGLPESGLIQATDGNLYGVTGLTIEPQQTYGTVFKITPGGALTTLHTFCAQGPPCSDGPNPNTLIQASDGNLYGTTSVGGGGSIFKITLGGALTIMYTFCTQNPPCSDGAAPESFIQASDGNFYGTTFQNGANKAGTFFKFTPSGTLTTLYSFCSQPNCADGQEPSTGLIQASDGNLYGTTTAGGDKTSEGTVFRITPAGTLTTLYRFCSQLACPDGDGPGSLIQATDGDLYGTTGGGGANNDGGTVFGGGTVFKITLGGALTTLYSFCPQVSVCPDGIGPHSLIQAPGGTFYGTTASGGANQDGTVFELTLAGTMGSPAISPNGIVSASAFGEFSFASPGSWIEIYGSNLAVDTRSWTGADFSGITAPTSLDGTMVSIGGQPAFIDYISPGQVNALIPSNVATGPQPLTVTTADATSAVYTLTVNAVEPGLLAPANFNIGGTQYVVALFADGTYVLPTGAISGLSSRPAKPGDEIVIYGIGFGPVTPDIPAGQLVQQANTLADSFQISIGGVVATPAYDGLAPDFTGLYQLNITVPSGIPSGAVPLTFTVDGVTGTQTLNIAVGN
jgi:uncharacterized protein (TIGR03437 family)